MEHEVPDKEINISCIELQDDCHDSSQHNGSSLQPPTKATMPSTKVEDAKGNNSMSQKLDKENSKITDGKDTSNSKGEHSTMGHCAKLRHNCCFQTFVFLVVSALDGADLIADWLLFKDVYLTKEGLVYGPPEDALVYALLAFSIVGTLTFIFEIVNLWWEIYRENPWINPDLASAITIWVEDIPQLVINILIALCREEAISYFQLVKASIMIAGVVIRFIVSLVRYCSKKNLAEIYEHDKKSQLHVAYRFLIMIGLVLILSGSLAVFFLTQFERTDSGSIKFNLPKTLFEGKYDEERYFQNVSIYFHHPVIDFDNDTGSNDVNWIRVNSIFNIREKGSEIFKLEFDKSTNSKIVFWHTNTSGTLVRANCYTLDKTTTTVTRGTNCINHLTGNTKAYIFKFQFIPKKIPNLLFGDVKFNCIVKENGACHPPMTSILTKLYESPTGAGGHKSDPIVHYYRTKGVPEDNHLLWSTGTTAARFYRNKGDLIDITEVWKTGFGYCESTGSLAPHIDTDMKIDCDV